MGNQKTQDDQPQDQSQGQGNFDNTQQHQEAGKKGGETTASEMEGTSFYHDIGQMGGSRTGDMSNEDQKQGGETKADESSMTASDMDSDWGTDETTDEG